MEKVKNKYGVEVGDIFYTSSSYSMTLPRFYEVVKTLGATKVVLRRHGDKVVNHDGYGQSGYLECDFNTWEDAYPEMTRITKLYGDKVEVKENEYYYLRKIGNRSEVEGQHFYFDYMD